jgi:predicted ATP-dependent serine protease
MNSNISMYIPRACHPRFLTGKCTYIYIYNGEAKIDQKQKSKKNKKQKKQAENKKQNQIKRKNKQQIQTNKNKKGHILGDGYGRGDTVSDCCLTFLLHH